MPRWLISDQTFTWFRQRYPGTEDTQTRDRLLHELILEWANAGAGAPSISSATLGRAGWSTWSS